jgi:hypothetical protein
VAKEQAVGGGIWLPTVVFAIFLTLKLTNHIGWSWWWVTSPLWIPAALVVAVMAVIGLGVAIAMWLDGRKLKRRKVA